MVGKAASSICLHNQLAALPVMDKLRHPALGDNPLTFMLYPLQMRDTPMGGLNPLVQLPTAPNDSLVFRRLR